MPVPFVFLRWRLSLGAFSSRRGNVRFDSVRGGSACLEATVQASLRMSCFQSLKGGIPTYSPPAQQFRSTSLFRSFASTPLLRLVGSLVQLDSWSHAV